MHDIIPDHVLELILLRLDSSVSLVRAASACKHWCRVVADAGFLSRFRLSVPLVMGHYHNSSNPPDFVPSSQTRSSIPISQCSLDFVPTAGAGGISLVWETVDSRDGLLLLRNRNRETTSSHRLDPDLLVCEPKARRYQPITMPDQLRRRMHQHLGTFLLKGGATGRRHGGDLSTSLSNFKVLVVLLDNMVAPGGGVPKAFVYLGSNYSWRAVTCAWKGSIDIPSATAPFYFSGRANGSLYWAIKDAGAALVLDERTAGVSLEALPVVSVGGWSEARRCFRVMGSEDGTTLRAVGLGDNDLRVFARFNGDDEWVLQSLLRLPEDTPGLSGFARIVAAHETYVVWQRATLMSKWQFSVNLRTMVVERVPKWKKRYYEGPGYPYELPWPPTLKA